MKGATAEPWVKTINAPNRSRMMTIGRSQNFLRSFINAHSSKRNSPIAVSPFQSELSCHVCARTRALHDPIALGAGLIRATYRVFAEEAPDQPHRRDEPVEHHAEENSRIDPTERLTARRPDPMDGPQDSGRDQGRNQQQDADGQGP